MDDSKTLYSGYSYTVEQDDGYSNSPLDWNTPEERGGVYFALSHRRYSLPWEIDAETENYSSWRELAEAVTTKQGAEDWCIGDGQLDGYNYKFVQWYEHSGISVKLYDTDELGGWDSGCAGVVFGQTDKAIESVFNQWKQYVEGDIWAVTVYDQQGEFVDALGGIYGYSDAEAEAEAIINYAQSRPRAGHHPVKASALHS